MAAWSWWGVFPLLNCDLKSITITVEELKVADSSSPFLAILHLMLPSLPPPQIKAGIRDQNFLKLLSFWHLQSQEFRDHVKIITCNWMRSISFCSRSYRQVLFLSFSYGFIEFEARGVIRSSNLTCCELQVIASYLDSPRWLWTQASISSGSQTVGK